MATEDNRMLVNRLAPLRDHPDGVIEHRHGQIGQVIVAKEGNELFLVFCPGDVPLSNEALSGVMSRIDLTNPLVLTGRYTQAMLACLAFMPDPSRVYVMGAGGARVPIVLHRLLERVAIKGSELDRDVLEISRRYFGFDEGPRMQIACAEGRGHLAGQRDGRFDHIYLDCYGADGRVPRALSTIEFFQMCAGKLAPGGVACVNLVDSNPDFAAQMDGFLGAFAQVHEIEFDGTHVLFGCGAGDWNLPDLLDTTRAIEERYPLGFDLSGYVKTLKQVLKPAVRVLRPLLDRDL